jgi:hypothetical protein
MVRLRLDDVTKRAIVVRASRRRLLLTYEGVFTPENGVVGVLVLRQRADGSYVEMAGQRAVSVELWRDDDDSGPA